MSALSNAAPPLCPPPPPVALAGSGIADGRATGTGFLRVSLPEGSAGQPGRGAGGGTRVARVEVAEFNVLSADDARTLVNGCLGVPRWVDEVAAARPE